MIAQYFKNRKIKQEKERQQRIEEEQKELKAHMQKSFLIDEFQMVALLKKANESREIRFSYGICEGFMMHSRIEYWIPSNQKKAYDRGDIWLDKVAEDIIGDDYTDLEAVDGKPKRPLDLGLCRIGAPK